jgi:hypothetical protein
MKIGLDDERHNRFFAVHFQETLAIAETGC